MHLERTIMHFVVSAKLIIQKQIYAITFCTHQNSLSECILFTKRMGCILLTKVKVSLATTIDTMVLHLNSASLYIPISALLVIILSSLYLYY